MNLKLLFTPEKSTRVLRVFHQTSYALLPMGLVTFFTHSPQCIPPIDLLCAATAVNFGFHSFVSCSFVITDYVKHDMLQHTCRILNTKLHALAVSGYAYSILKKYKHKKIVE